MSDCEKQAAQISTINYTYDNFSEIFIYILYAHKFQFHQLHYEYVKIFTHMLNAQQLIMELIIMSGKLLAKYS